MLSNDNVKCAVDLLWVRHNQVGGIESYIRNILDGFMELEANFELWLLVSKDNADSFGKYKTDRRFHLYACDVESANVKKRIIWQNMHLGNIIRSLGLDKCFEPYYCKPIFGCGGINFFTTIQDLQAMHFPEYFSKGKVIWMKFAWWNAVRTSKKVIATSEFVKNDILEHYAVDKNKLRVINIPVVVDKSNVMPVELIENKYNVKRGEYFFTVSSLLPHKNVSVLLDVMAKINKEKLNLPNKLIVSGVGGKSRTGLEQKIIEQGLADSVILTQFINNDERNALYKNCKSFLFPSIFEGFGMPPVEAMMFGVPVVTTRKASLEEVTKGKANYVDDPFDVDEWLSKIANSEGNIIDFYGYNKENIAQQYNVLFKKG